MAPEPPSSDPLPVEPVTEPITEMTTERMATGGEAVARAADGRVVFVRGALPGERVRVVIDERHSRWLRGHAVEVTHASDLRIEPPCPYVADGCGGCDWQHVDTDAALGLKAGIVADTLTRIAKLRDPDVRPGVPLSADSYRTTVRAVVEKGDAGFRKRRSHEACPVDSCLVAHPLVETLLTDVDWGDASEVMIRCGARTGERMALVTPTSEGVEVPDDVVLLGADDLRARNRGRRRGRGRGRGRGDARVPEPQRTWITEEVEGVPFRVSARSFWQAGSEGLEALSASVRSACRDRLGSDATVADLYGGVGVLGCLLARGGNAARVVCVERGASAVADARHNLAVLAAEGIDARVVRADVARWRTESCDVVVADPSREGLGRDVTRVVAGTGASRLVLVSCDPASLARDTSLLSGHGYRFVQTTLVDMFPRTSHVETVTRFDRA